MDRAPRRTTAQIQRDLKTAIKMKHAAKKGPLSSPCESSTYTDVSPADAAGIQDDASSALCNAMGDLGIDPEVRRAPKEAHLDLPIVSGASWYLLDRPLHCGKGPSQMIVNHMASHCLSPTLKTCLGPTCNSSQTWCMCKSLTLHMNRRQWTGDAVLLLPPKALHGYCWVDT